MANIDCQCGSKTGDLILTPNTIHYAKVVCYVCRKFIRWDKAPKNKDKRGGLPEPEKVAHFHGFNDIFCFFCGRDYHKLGDNETITIDHIQKIADGGVDELENMQILCSACHKLKHWTELYLHKHMEKYFRDSNGQ